MEKLVVVDDDEVIRKQMKWGLSREYEVLLARDRAEALALVSRHRPRAVTLDLGLPPDAEGTSEGLLALREIAAASPSTKVVVITGNGARESALQAVACGAYDYCAKPLDLAEASVILKRAYHLSAIEEENARLQQVLGRGDGFCGIIGECPPMQQVYATIRKVAASDVPVLVTGESGTGKELVARALQWLSRRKNAPFIPINAGAIPENLLEAELFGHEKGAFTGAHSRVQGKVEYANNGTLFLDEIGELPAALQVKLLRFLQDKVIQRVGGRDFIGVDARIISATNRDILGAIAAGTFREDLYYRIAVISIHLPPLRERGGDIMLLADLFLKKFSVQLGKKVRGFTPQAEKAIVSHSWPGNVRELENRVQRAVLMADAAVVTAEALGLGGGEPEGETGHAGTLREVRDRVERELVIDALRRGNSITKAAEMLGVSRPTLYDLIRKHRLESATE